MQRLIKDKHQLRSEVSRVAAEFEKEKTTRLKANNELLKRYKEIDCLLKEKVKLEIDVSRFKAELKREKTDRLKMKDKLAEAQKEFEYIKWCLHNKRKKSLSESFQNADDQVHLGFPGLDLVSITLDLYKVVEGENLVTPPPQR